MINVPGTPASLPACWDGYPMTQRGELRRALSIALTASATGGLCSALMLAFAAAPFATFALKFPQPVFFAPPLLGLIRVIAFAKHRPAVTTLLMFAGIHIGHTGVAPPYGYPVDTLGLAGPQQGHEDLGV